MSIREKFIVPKRYNTISIALMVMGILAIIGLYVTCRVFKRSSQAGKVLGQSFAEQCLLFIDCKCGYVLYLRHYAGMGWFSMGFSPGIGSYFSVCTGDRCYLRNYITGYYFWR